MSFLPKELHAMLIERGHITDLKEVARVNKDWREYIEKHEEKLGLTSAPYVIIDGKVKIHLREVPEDVFCADDEVLEPKIVPSVRAACLYGPFACMEIGEVFCQMPVDQEEMDQLVARLSEIPDFMLRSINDLTITVFPGMYLLPFLNRFASISKIRLIPDTAEEVKEIIENGPHMDSLILDCRVGAKFNDDVLQWVMNKSEEHPTTFPKISLAHFVGSDITFPKFIRFMEEMNFSNILHEFCFTKFGLTSFPRNDWLSWINANATSLNITGEDNNRFLFAYRGHQFDMNMLLI